MCVLYSRQYLVGDRQLLLSKAAVLEHQRRPRASAGESLHLF